MTMEVDLGMGGCADMVTVVDPAVEVTLLAGAKLPVNRPPVQNDRMVLLDSQLLITLCDYVTSHAYVCLSSHSTCM